MADNFGYAKGYIDLDTSGITRNLDNAQNRFNNFISATGQKMQSWGSNISNTGSQLTMFTAPLTAIGVLGVKAAASFDDSLTEIQARTGITNEALNAVRDEALKLGKDTAFSSQQAADAFLQLTTAGLTVNQAMAALPAVLDGAAAGNIDLGQAADLATNVMSAFKLKAEDTTKIIDAMARASASSPADMQQMGEALQSVGGLAQSMGLDVDRTSAILAIFAKNGLRGSEAGTQLRSMLRNMTSGTAKTNQAWQDLGVSLFDSNGQMRDLDTVFKEISAAMANMPMEDQIRISQDLAGAYGIVGFNALLGGDGIASMEKTMEGQASASEIAKKRMSDFAGRIKYLTGSVQTLMIKAFTPLMNNFLAPLLEHVINFVDKIDDWISKNEALTGNILSFLTVFVAVGPMLFGVGKAISFIGFMITQLTNPLSLAIALGALFVKAYQDNFLGMQDALAPMILFFQNLFTALMGGGADLFTNSPLIAFFQNLAVIAQDVFGRILSFIWTFFSLLNDGISPINSLSAALSLAFGPQIANMIAVYINAFITGIQAIATWITNVALPALMNFGIWLMNLWLTAQPYLAALFNWFMNVGLPMAINFITTTVIPAVLDFIGFLTRLWTDVQPFLQFLFDWFMNVGLPMMLNFLSTYVFPTIENFAGLISDIWTKAQPFLQQLYDWFITTGLPAIQDFIAGPFTTAFQGMLNLLSGAWSFINTGITAFRDHLSDIFNWIKTNVIQPVIDIVNKLFGLFSDVISKAQDVGNTVMNAIPGGKDAMAGWGLAGDTIGKVFSGEIDPGKFGQAAWNAIFGGGRDIGGPGQAGMAYRIGTGAQPEMFIPSSDGYFVPNTGGNGLTIQNMTVVSNDPENWAADMRQLELAGG